MWVRRTAAFIGKLFVALFAVVAFGNAVTLGIPGWILGVWLFGEGGAALVVAAACLAVSVAVMVEAGY